MNGGRQKLKRKEVKLNANIQPVSQKGQADFSKEVYGTGFAERIQFAAEKGHSYKIPSECQKWDGTINYTTLPSNIAKNDSRNNLIVDLLKQEKDNYCLILSDRLEGLEILHNKIGGLFINGNMTTKKAKQERDDAIEKMRNKEEHYLFATYSLAKERFGY